MIILPIQTQINKKDQARLKGQRVVLPILYDRLINKTNHSWHPVARILYPRFATSRFFLRFRVVFFCSILQVLAVRG